MLKVKVFVNDNCIDEVNFWNVSQEYGVGIQTYRVFNSKMKLLMDVKHEFTDGYWKLIEKVLPKLKTKPMSKKYKENLKKIRSKVLKKINL